MSRKMTELPPCPCCGEQPEATFVHLPYLHGCWHIDCTNPECTKKPGTWYYYHFGDAVSEWNELAGESRSNEQECYGDDWFVEKAAALGIEGHY